MGLREAMDPSAKAGSIVTNRRENLRSLLDGQFLLTLLNLNRGWNEH
jgi:hypothetical protein